MKQKLHTQLAARLGLLACTALLSTGMAANWPQWRNDAGNGGKSAENINLPLQLQWHSAAPEVEENGAVVANGIAYMSTEDGWLYAFTVSSGFVVPGFPVRTADNYGTPAVDTVNGKIYVLAGGLLYAFNLNGTPAWTRSVGSLGYNFNQGPVIDLGFVYIKAGGHIIKYDAAGTLQWSVGSLINANTQPAVMGDYVYVNNESSQIRKFRKSDGVEITSGGFPIATTYSQAALAAVNGKIYHKANLLYAYDSNTGALIWSATCGGDSTYYGSPAVSGGFVYVYGWDGKIYAFKETDGTTAAGFPSVALNTSGDRNWGSPAVAGDKIFIGAGTTQKLKVLGAAGSAQPGIVLAEYNCFSTDFQGFDLCSAIISDGYVFAMLDGGGLYAFFGGQGFPPAGALLINNGAKCTDSRNVVLTLDNENNPDVTEMRISEDPFFGGAPFQPYTKTSNFTLSLGYGPKTVYAQLKDKNGLVSNVFSAQIAYQGTCNCADLNGDGVVNTADMKLMQGAIGKLKGQVGYTAAADYDGDGVITLNDYRTWYACYKDYVIHH